MQFTIMRHYNPKTMKPNAHQFHQIAGDKISEKGKASLAFRLVHDLYQMSEKLYKTLDIMTSENLSQFKDADYLKPAQEHSLVALTAIYAGDLRTQTIHDVVDNDTTITDVERSILRNALENYKLCAESVHAALGNPRWAE